MVSHEKDARVYSSPACFMHEVDEQPQSWDEIKAWRTARRKERILQRLGCERSER